ncbi:hypothetical protein [Candidatus Rhabdochlamydia sp. W815]|uniref:hypothetical protein n=1 Tax=Candidatus Rhabdochlamydia sp. W815 TaxID=2720721 RepID=UPI001BFCBD9D|nr:hypothetical protein [Candidatus Rhabdochlamydia sp. W815]
MAVVGKILLKLDEAKILLYSPLSKIKRGISGLKIMAFVGKILLKLDEAKILLYSPLSKIKRGISGLALLKDKILESIDIKSLLIKFDYKNIN